MKLDWTLLDRVDSCVEREGLLVPGGGDAAQGMRMKGCAQSVSLESSEMRRVILSALMQSAESDLVCRSWWGGGWVVWAYVVILVRMTYDMDC